MKYYPTKKSISAHDAPEWYRDAKLGIFIHWGLYSVPAFGPTDVGGITETVGNHGFKYHFVNNPYAEWYQNSLRQEEGPYKEYHQKTYGADFKYEEFAPMFNEAIKKWDPNTMAEVFQNAGAKYAVITTKHHDGFCLWPSKEINPNIKNYIASRDIIKELTDAIHAKDMKMGLYYSGAFDWTFTPNKIEGVLSSITNGSRSPEYASYCDNQVYELINDYKPDILWNDIAYPGKGKLLEVLAHYYNTVPHGVINDRWRQLPNILWFFNKFKFIRKIVDKIGQSVVKKVGFGTNTKLAISDYTTPEYAPTTQLFPFPWECCRGIGHSFGYNQFETEEHYLSTEELIHSFIDIVSKNGNLLINVGPMADGTIPPIQQNRILALGDWLKKNGEGIYGTRPWEHAEGESTLGIPVRFTKKENNIFVFLLGTPSAQEILIKNLQPSNNSKIILMNSKTEIEWKRDGNDLKLIFPEIPEKSEIALGLKIQAF
jgi:alpha-L-fucosidase